MKYNKFTSNAGHSPKSPGAKGSGYKEEIIAREFNSLFIKKMKEVGAYIIDTTSEASTSSAVLQEQVKKANAIPKAGKLNISWHLNSNAGNPATGVEVLYYSTKELAAEVSALISKITGLKNRGAKERKDLFFLRNTSGDSILIELGFINNQNDMKVLISKKEEIINSLVKYFTGKETKKETPKTETKQTQTIYKILSNGIQFGAYSSIENILKIVESKLRNGENEITIKKK